ncbi:MAG: MBL fold metallo-hydrolase [Euryarchaeota archaeon]|nr:MBL fold metallo-hydrolase [Euryarchaeota archaeon]
MELTVVYDNKADAGLISGWGFSCYIESDQHRILFDTGWDGCALLENLDSLDIDIRTIDTMVLSHQHWDHIGGLSHVLNACPGMDVYVPTSFSTNLKKEIAKVARLHEVRQAQSILPGVYTTGELGSDIKEQSLVLEGDRGVWVVTGCAHPGLAEIMEAASQFGDVVGIIGGLHASEEYDLLAGLEYIGAGHCTVHQQEIAERYPDSYEAIRVGSCIQL